MNESETLSQYRGWKAELMWAPSGKTTSKKLWKSTSDARRWPFEPQFVTTMTRVPIHAACQRRWRSLWRQWRPIYSALGKYLINWNDIYHSEISLSTSCNGAQGYSQFFFFQLNFIGFKVSFIGKLAPPAVCLWLNNKQESRSKEYQVFIFSLRLSCDHIHSSISIVMYSIYKDQCTQTNV